MNYCLVSENKYDHQEWEKCLEENLLRYPQLTCGFTKGEFGKIADYDLLKIVQYFYGQLDPDERELLVASAEKVTGINEIKTMMDEWSDENERTVFFPLSCLLIDRINDLRMKMMVYESLFVSGREMILDSQDESYLDMITLLHTAYFLGLAREMNIKSSFSACMNRYYQVSSMYDLVRILNQKIQQYGQHWNKQWINRIIRDVVFDDRARNISESECFNTCSLAIKRIERIQMKNSASVIHDSKGILRIIRETDLIEHHKTLLHGFECHFCSRTYSDEEYIIVFQEESRICNVYDDESAWEVRTKSWT